MRGVVGKRYNGCTGGAFANEVTESQRYMLWLNERTLHNPSELRNMHTLKCIRQPELFNPIIHPFGRFVPHRGGRISSIKHARNTENGRLRSLRFPVSVSLSLSVSVCLIYGSYR